MKKVLLLSLIVLTSASFSDTSSLSTQTDKISSIRDTKKSWPVRIYFAKEKDSLPESFRVTGKVVAESKRAPDCGGDAYGGTLKIRPSEKIEGYKPEFVYVIIFCLSGSNEGFLGQTISLDLTKAYEDEHPCHCDLIENEFDSEGIPFYCVADPKTLNNK